MSIHCPRYGRGYGDSIGSVSNYGGETVDKIKCSGPVCLHGTKVIGKVKAGGGISATDAKVGKIAVIGTASLWSTVCNGKVYAHGKISANNVEAPTLDAEGSIEIVNSSALKKGAKDLQSIF